jgi:glucose-fructose oxidoreductase
MAAGEPLRYGVVGLGWISQVAVLPAFANARENSQLAALVSDDDAKLEKLGARYGVERRYKYAQYDECLKHVDAVYIALPNHMHREYTVRAARAGVHVLCEKPMAVTEPECEEMIRTVADHRVRLMIAYRLHFEEANLAALEVVRSGRLGEPRYFSSEFSQQVPEGNVRLRGAMGGGPLYDIGIYCINAARGLFGDEPREVFAWAANNGEARFREVEEAAAVVMRFPGERLADFTCSFGADGVNAYRIAGTRGDLRVEPAYDFQTELRHEMTVEGRREERVFPRRDQFAPELIYFSDCILRNREPEPSGEEGLADVRIIRALHRSIEAGAPVRMPAVEGPRRPGPRQRIDRPAVKEPGLVHAQEPARS